MCLAKSDSDDFDQSCIDDTESDGINGDEDDHDPREANSLLLCWPTDEMELLEAFAEISEKNTHRELMIRKKGVVSESIVLESTSDRKKIFD